MVTDHHQVMVGSRSTNYCLADRSLQRPAAKPAGAKAGHVQLEHLAFRYPTYVPVIRDDELVFDH